MTTIIPPSSNQQQRTLALLAGTPGWRRLCELRDDLNEDLAAAILGGAGELADEELAPINGAADREGCAIVNGQVRVPASFKQALRLMAEGGWIGIDLPAALGGSGLPFTMQAASAQILDRGCVAFTMCVGGSRAGAWLLAEHAPEGIVSEWVPEVIAGRRTVTICISEAGAGSDLGRINTKATLDAGIWKVAGQKMWTSFGDHDLSAQIGHCVLARTSNAPGTRGLSLFLVPTLLADGRRNRIETIGIERKLGLHASPTCSLSFDGAEGILIGEPEKGLSQLFTMIELMRLQTGCQGLGIATAAVDVAEAYAQERRQGGEASLPAVRIIEHPDVRRQLGVLRSCTEILRAAVLELATAMDLARTTTGREAVEASAYASFLLPLIKNFGAETGFDVANGAIQVLGGAGYTCDWPVEQLLRDSRVLSIYEGTTGMQAWDFLDRRLLRDPSGFSFFVSRSHDLPRESREVIQRFEALGEELRRCENGAMLQCVADDWLRAGWLALTALLIPRLKLADPLSAQVAAAQLRERFAVHEASIRAHFT